MLIEMDCLNVVETCNSTEFDQGTCGNLLSELKSILAKDRCLGISHVRRTRNSIAHELDHFSQGVESLCVWKGFCISNSLGTNKFYKQLKNTQKLSWRTP